MGPRTAGLEREQSVPLNGNIRCLDLAGKLQFPPVARVQLREEYPRVIRWQLHPRLIQDAHLGSAQPPQEETHLQQDVLASTGPICRWTRAPVAAYIIPGYQDHREPNVGIVLELLHDRPALVRLLVEDDGFEFESVQDPCDGLLDRLVVPMDKEDTSAERRRHGRQDRGRRRFRLFIYDVQELFEPHYCLLDAILGGLLFSIVTDRNPWHALEHGGRGLDLNQCRHKVVGFIGAPTEEVAHRGGCGFQRNGCLVDERGRLRVECLQFRNPALQPVLCLGRFFGVETSSLWWRTRRARRSSHVSPFQAQLRPDLQQPRALGLLDQEVDEGRARDHHEARVSSVYLRRVDERMADAGVTRPTVQGADSL